MITAPFWSPEPPAVTAMTPAPHGNDEARRKHVLIVEDDPAIGPLMGDILAEAGFAVTLAATGTEAVIAAERDRPDVITLDLMLPGMSGDQVLRKLRSDPSTSTIPVVIVSAYGAGFPGALASANAFIAKPFDVDDLITAVESVAQ